MKKIRKFFAYFLIAMSIFISCGTLFLISGFVFIQGVPELSKEFVTNDFKEK
jgi:hypothetical protein